jgi:hypothetical protein
MDKYSLVQLLLEGFSIDFRGNEVMTLRQDPRDPLAFKCPSL